MIVDSGVLVAAAVRAQPNHARAVEILRSQEPLAMVESAIAEVDYFIRKLRGTNDQLRFLASLDSFLAVHSPTKTDRGRAREVLAEYSNGKLSYVDAITVAVAERVRERRIATFNPRHFGFIRPRYLGSFDIIG